MTKDSYTINIMRNGEDYDWDIEVSEEQLNRIYDILLEGLDELWDKMANNLVEKEKENSEEKN
jgi:hypothetical protein